MPRQLRTPSLMKSADAPVTLFTLPGVVVTRDAAAPVATVMLDRPSKRNALDHATLVQLEVAFDRLHGREDVRVIILAGRGRSFSAGHDLSSKGDGAGGDGEPGGWNLRAPRARLRQGARTIRAIRDCDAVTVARVHGHAIGGGFGLMLACDLRYVARGTALYLPEVDLGNPVPWGLTPMLVHSVGAAVAKEMVLLTDEIAPDRAHQLGLVNGVCADERALAAEVDRVAYAVAAKPSAATLLAKAQFRSLRLQEQLGDVTEYEPDWMLLSKM
eukprot:g7080.t1